MEELHKETADCKTLSDYANFLKERLMLNVKEVDDGIELHLENEECPVNFHLRLKITPMHYATAPSVKTNSSGPHYLENQWI